MLSGLQKATRAPSATRLQERLEGQVAAPAEPQQQGPLSLEQHLRPKRGGEIGG